MDDDSFDDAVEADRRAMEQRANLPGPLRPRRPEDFDAGLFHVFDNDDRARFVDALRSVITPDGRYHMLCFSDRQSGDWGPRRVTQDEIRASFSEGWHVDSIDSAAFDINLDPGRTLAWRSTITRS